MPLCRHKFERITVFQHYITNPLVMVIENRYNEENQLFFFILSLEKVTNVSKEVTMLGDIPKQQRA